MDDLHGVGTDVLRVQLRARRTMKREVVWFYVTLLAGTRGTSASAFRVSWDSCIPGIPHGGSRCDGEVPVGAGPSRLTFACSLPATGARS